MNMSNRDNRQERPISTVKRLIICAAILLAAPFSGVAADEPGVLIYTKNQIGKGLFVHDNIAASVVAFKKLGAENHFAVEASDDPGEFTTTNLQRFKVIVFDNSNNEIFDTEEQKAALQHFVQAGGGIVGIHSCSGSMRHWPWFWSMMGGKFARHAKLQTFTVEVKDANNPSTAHLPRPLNGRMNFISSPTCLPICTSCWRATRRP